MKFIFFPIPDPEGGSDNIVTRFCDNPAIRVKKVDFIPASQDGMCLKAARLIVAYESLSDEEQQQRAARYESITLKRLAKTARSLWEQPGYMTLKSDATRVLHIQAFCGVSKEEAETITDLIKIPHVIEKLLEGEP